jgi:hypothetical protein
MTYIELPKGTGAHTIPKYAAMNTYCKNKKSIVTIANNDKLCLARALVVGISKYNETPLNFRNVKIGRPIQCQLASQLCLDSRVNLNHTNGGGIPELRKFQDHLTDYTITVFTDVLGRETIFKGPPSTQCHPRNNIDILLDEKENHYYTILNIQGAFSCKFYCRNCKVRFEHPGGHTCMNSVVIVDIFVLAMKWLRKYFAMHVSLDLKGLIALHTIRNRDFIRSTGVYATYTEFVASVNSIPTLEIRKFTLVMKISVRSEEILCG